MVGYTVVYDDSSKPTIGLAYSEPEGIISSAFSFFGKEVVESRIERGLNLASRRGLVLERGGRPLGRNASRMMLKIRRAMESEITRVSLVDALYTKYITDFEKRVYLSTLSIPLGQTRTYSELAVELGTSARAVGQALKRNPFSPIIPCHRVVGKKGLGGFYGKDGIEDKRLILEFEEMIAKGE